MERTKPMRVMSRCYPDGQTKPHLRHDELDGTFKADIDDESDIPQVLEDFAQFLLDSLSAKEEREEDDTTD